MSEWSLRTPENILAVGVKPHVPQSNTVHQLLGAFELAIATENGVDEFTTGIATHGHSRLAAVFALGRFPHELLAGLEQLLDAAPESFATFQKVLDGVLVVGMLDAPEGFVGPLDFPRQLDQQQPEVARDIGHRGGGPVVEDGPVVDPFAQRVGVKDTAQEHDRGFGGVPVLVGVSGGDAGTLGILLGGLGGGLGGRRLGLGRSGAGGGGLTAGAGAILLGGIHIIIGWHLVVIKVVISGGFCLAIVGRRRSTGRRESSVVANGIIDHIHIDMPLQRRRRTRTTHGPTTGSTYRIVLAARWRTKLRHGLLVVIEPRGVGRRIPCGRGFLGWARVAGLATMPLGRPPGRDIGTGELRRVVGVMRRSRRRVGVVVRPPRRIVIHYNEETGRHRKVENRHTDNNNILYRISQKKKKKKQSQLNEAKKEKKNQEETVTAARKPSEGNEEVEAVVVSRTFERCDRDRERTSKGFGMNPEIQKSRNPELEDEGSSQVQIEPRI